MREVIGHLYIAVVHIKIQKKTYNIYTFIHIVFYCCFRVIILRKYAKSENNTITMFLTLRYLK